MCTQFHPDSFLGKMTNSLEEIIRYDGKKFGELVFNTLPPRLGHLEENPTANAQINNAIGLTLLTLMQHYEFLKPCKLQNCIYDRKITPTRYAGLLVAMAQLVTSKIVIQETNESFRLKIPKRKDFGKKRIYFKLLHMITGLSIHNLLLSHNLVINFKENEKELLNLIKLENTKKSENSKIH